MPKYLAPRTDWPQLEASQDLDHMELAVPFSDLQRVVTWDNTGTYDMEHETYVLNMALARCRPLYDGFEQDSQYLFGTPTADLLCKIMADSGYHFEVWPNRWHSGIKVQGVTRHFFGYRANLDAPSHGTPVLAFKVVNNAWYMVAVQEKAVKRMGILSLHCPDCFASWNIEGLMAVRDNQDLDFTRFYFEFADGCPRCRHNQLTLQWGDWNE